MTVAERLSAARRSLGLTLEQVEQKTGIGVSSLSEFENGKREPRLSQLQVLATAYRTSLAAFFEDRPPTAQVVLWRERPSSPQAEQVERDFIRLCEQYRNLENWLDEVRSDCLPLQTGDAKTFSYKDAERLAHEVHKKLGLGHRPGQSLLLTLEEVCGVKVFHMLFEPSGSAACTRSDAFGAAILLNSGNVRWRRNYDLAHELFHLLTWDIFRTAANGEHPQPDDKEERLANAFASALLIPADAAQEAIDARSEDDKISFSDMGEIARQFDVSVDALCWRMVSLRYFKRDEASDIIQRCKSVCSRAEIAGHQDAPPARPERFKALAIRALRSGELSLGRFSEYMDVSRTESARYLEQEAQEDEEVSLTAS